jgi:hypothetical protein
MPFLTDLDSRAAVKGSRDPLGIQQIWTRLGRHVVGNLTTVSTSVRDYATLLLGYYFAEEIAEDVGPGSELATFMKWEQLAAYCRAHCNKDLAFRGTEKVQRTLSEGTRVHLSADRIHQILASQKTYGLWGLYTVPARSSGLLDGEPARLTPAARAFVEDHYLQRLGGSTGRHVCRILDLLRQKQTRLDIAKADEPLAKAVGLVLAKQLTAKEKAFYREHLLDGGPLDATNGLQQQAVELFAPTFGDESWSFTPRALRHFAKEARAPNRSWVTVAHHLDRIATCETVMGPAATLFGYMQGLDGKSLKAVSDRLRDAWGPGLRTVDPAAFGELQPEIASGDRSTGERWVAVADALAGGDYGTAVATLVDQNKAVMAGRGGASWVEVRNGTLRVRVSDESGRLPERRQIADLWRFPYFLDSLRIVGATLAGGSHG